MKKAIITILSFNFITLVTACNNAGFYNNMEREKSSNNNINSAKETSISEIDGTITSYRERININRLVNNQEENIKHINLGIKDYATISDVNKKWVRDNLIKEVQRQKGIFQKHISYADLKSLCLLVGITGAGKSTLFDYLNDLPLVSFNKSGFSKLKVPTELLNEVQKKVYASIGHGGTSETTIPNFYSNSKLKSTLVDCAGEFDNKDILQSIVNSYFKYDLALASQRVKIIMVINYETILNNRGVTLSQFMGELECFIGDWECFAKSQSCAIVLTNIKYRKNYSESSIIKEAKENLAEAVSAEGISKKFVDLVNEIIEREAIGFFFRPSDDDADSKRPYKAPSKLGSVEYISSVINNTRFLLKKQWD